MDLKDYIEKSLYSIIAAVGGVQENVNELGVLVFPSTVKEGFIDESGKQQLMNIKFDVAVTVGKNTTQDKGMSIKVIELISGGIKTTDTNQNQSISRINFEIPVAMPILDNLDDKAKEKQSKNLERIASLI